MSGCFGFAGLAARMIFRASAKLASLLLLMVLLSFFLTCAVLLHNGLKEAAFRGAKRLGADLLVVPKGAEISPGAGLFGGLPVRLSLPEGLEQSIAAVPGVVQVAPQYILASAHDSCCETGDLLLVGFDPSRDMTVLSWLRPDGRIKEEKGYILVGGAVMKARGAAMRFYNHTFTVAARLEKSGSEDFNKAVFIPLSDVKAMEISAGKGAGTLLAVPWGRPSILLLQLAPSISPHDVALLLERQYPAVRAVTLPDLTRENKLRMSRLALCLYPLAVAAWLFAVLAGGALQYLYWRERRQSMALLYAFGCGKGRILLCSGSEALAIALAGIAAGSIGGLFSLRFIAPHLGMTIGVPLLADGISLAASDLPWLWVAFAGTMAVEAVIVVYLLLQREPADLLRGI